MLKIALGAEFNSEKMFKDVAALASKYKGVQLHTHVAENPVSLLSCLEHRLEKACLSTQSKYKIGYPKHNICFPTQIATNC